MGGLFITVLLLSMYFVNGKAKKKTTKSTATSKRTTTITSSTRRTTKTTTTLTRRTATTPSVQPSITNSATISSKETVTSQITWMSTPTKIRTLRSTGMSITSITALTTTRLEKTNTTDNTHFTHKSPGTSGDSDSVVVPVVLVFVLVLITLAAVIVFLLWRRLKQQKPMGGCSGRSISNRGYENDHSLDRHISSQDMHPDDSVYSEYAEISPGDLDVEERPGNVYQTIDNLPEDKTEFYTHYGHLKMQTTKFIDNNYSHVVVNQNGIPSSDATYAHTGNTINAHELIDDGENETTYNHLEKNANKTQGNQQPLNKEEKELVDDLEAEYNHAKAGQLSLEPDNNGDTYSHLNNTQNSRGIKQDDFKFLTHGTKTQTYGTKTRKLDSNNDDGKTTFPEYAKCSKNVNEKETSSQVGRDGYETPSGTANTYFTLEPESKIADTDETFEDSESEESPNHQYFILEKTDTDT